MRSRAHMVEMWLHGTKTSEMLLLNLSVIRASVFNEKLVVASAMTILAPDQLPRGYTCISAEPA